MIGALGGAGSGPQLAVFGSPVFPLMCRAARHPFESPVEGLRAEVGQG